MSVKIGSPTSHSRVRIHLSPVDAAVAFLAPILALHLRNALALSVDGGVAALVYCLLSVVFSLIAFAVFRIDGAIPRYLSVNDLGNLAAAVLVAELLTCAVLFSVTRLDGIPRSVPAIHALLLGAGLLAVRGLVHFVDKPRTPRSGEPTTEPEHVIIVGLNDLSVLFMRFLEATSGGQRRVIALLDEKPRWFGRSVSGVRIFGPPAHLDALIEEFVTHGVRTDYVVIGVEAQELSEASLREIRRVCADRQLELVFVPQFFTHDLVNRPGVIRQAAGAASHMGSIPVVNPATAILPSVYFRCRRSIDFIAALALAIGLMPLWLLGTMVAFFDVGTPVTFWQQRTGKGGGSFQLYKLRTLRPAFDRHGRKLPDEQRLSRAGRLLRQTRLDELPQLLNVLIGDMALIGPRPLLPHDQPPNPAIRLSVRPGITGWAQVNGGALLSPMEKDSLDAWYVVNASPWTDLQIVAMTFRSLARGDRRSEEALLRARHDTASARAQTSSRFAANGAEVEEKGRAAARSL
jgi:lipopolysaccharide/colanic/teichoic acid biosynthesis glycosyltransferase